MLESLMPSIKCLITSDYSLVKTEESERLIADMLKGLTPSLTPELKQISGVPGAGKSTYCSSHLPPNFLFLSFDKIMISLCGYQKDLLLQGVVYAYKKYEMTARIIGYELLRRAINLRLNIMFEHSGTNQAHLELFAALKKLNYITSVECIVCQIPLALKRVEERAKTINRYVPEKLILERAQDLKSYMSAYEKLAAKVTFLDGADNFRVLKKI